MLHVVWIILPSSEDFFSHPTKGKILKFFSYNLLNKMCTQSRKNVSLLWYKAFTNIAHYSYSQPWISQEHSQHEWTDKLWVKSWV